MIDSYIEDFCCDHEYYKCPHCGHYKALYGYVIYIANDLTLWSDLRMADNPVHPYRSMIQRCPVCGKYHIFHPAYCQDFVDEDMPNFYELGKLPLEHLHCAFQQLSAEETNPMNVLHEYVWAFNDRYGDKEKDEIPIEDWKMFETVARRIIPQEQSRLNVAELFRELGEFEIALQMYSNLTVIPEQQKWLRAMKQYAERCSRKVFKLEGGCLRPPVTLENYHEKEYVPHSQ